MASPPNSPSRNLRGASRTTGGIIRGRAQGNVLNHADMLDFGFETQAPLLREGQVRVFTSHAQAQDQPNLKMVFDHEVTESLAPILRTLKRRCSDFYRRYYFLKYDYYFITCI